MQSANCLCSASAAVRHVFLGPALSRRMPRRPPISLGPAPRRTYNSRLPRDHGIPNTHCTVIDAGGIRHEAMPTRHALRLIDTKTQHLIAVSAPSDPAAPAVCKIVTKAELARLAAQELARLKEARKKVPAKVVKTLEMNWAIDGHDLAHRVEKLREFLGKGYKVEVVISPKRRGRLVGLAEAEGVVRRLREVVRGEEGVRFGWRERREMEGAVAERATLFFEGKVVPRAMALAGGGEDGAREGESDAEATEMEFARKEMAQR